MNIGGEYSPPYLYNSGMISIEEAPLLLDHDINVEVFIYVNPITGKHISFNKLPSTLAVFISELQARECENISNCLRNSIGYYVSWEEMLTIANKECGGRYELFRPIA